MIPATLFVVATPIGNLEDISLRALRILKSAAVIAAEDTRVTAKLLSHSGISTPMVSIRGERAARNIKGLIERLGNGEDVALVTDAGTPSVSDPGYDLVLAAHDAGIPVSPIPGPSALASAVSAVGLRGEGVRFLGFLPRAGRRRKALLASLKTERAMVVIYESPRRAAATLGDLAEALGQRTGAVLRELTKIHEEIVRGPLSELRDRFADGTKGELIIAVEGMFDTEHQDVTAPEIEKMIEEELLAGRSVKDVAQAISSGFGLSRKAVYQTALSLHRKCREAGLL